MKKSRFLAEISCLAALAFATPSYADNTPYKASAGWNLDSPSSYGWLEEGKWGQASDHPNSQAATPSITFGNWGDDYIGKDAVNFGGHQQDDSRPVNIYAEPYGSMNLGTVLTINMQGRIAYGIRAGLAPTGLDGNGGINSYPDFDAVGVFNFAGSSVPRFTTNGVIKDNEGNVHNVTFDKNHIYFDNAIPPEWIKLLRPKMHVMTNIIGSTHADPDPHNRQPLDTWAGDIVQWDPAGKWIQVEGWRVLGGNMAAADYVPGQAVGKSGDVGYVAANTYDTKRSKYTVPTVFFGVYTKAFNRNTMCFLERGGAPGDGNNPKGTIDAQTQECEADEIDLQNNLPDYEGREHGITITYNGPSKPTNDSYDLGLFGQNVVMMRIWGGADTVDIWGDAIWVHGDGGLQHNDKYTKAGSAQETAEFNSFVDGTSDMRLVNWLYRHTDATKTIGYTTASMRLGLIVDGNKGSVDGDGSTQHGTIQSYIEFNPLGYQGGMGLCGYSSCGVYVNSNGDFSIANHTLWMSQSAIAFVKSDKSIGGQISGDDAGDVVIGSGTAGAHVKMTYPLAPGTRADGNFQVDTLNTSSASNWISDDGTNTLFGGQGTIIGWNLFSGDASTYFINVGHGREEGFKFYNKYNGGSLASKGTSETPIVMIGSDGHITAQGDIVAYKHNIVGTGLISSKIDGTPGAYFSTSETDGGPILNSNLHGLFHLQLAMQADGDVTGQSLSIHDTGDVNHPYDPVYQETFMPRANMTGGIWHRSYRNEVFNSVIPASDGTGFFYFGSSDLVSGKGGFKIDANGTIYLTQSNSSIPVIKSPELWAGMQSGVGPNANDKQAFFETAAFVDGSNNDRLVAYQKRVTARDSSHIGWSNTEVHVANIIDGPTGNASAGVQQSEIVFAPGSIALRSYNGTGLTVKPTGDVVFDTGAAMTPVTYDALGTGTTVGFQRYCTNCYSPLTGEGSTHSIPVFWNGTVWTDMAGNPVNHD